MKAIPYAVLVLALIGGLLSAGCGDSGKDEAEAAARHRESELARLRSLPYVGGTSVKTNAPDGVIVYDRDRSQSGYNLYTIHAQSAAELIDAEGALIRRWEYDVHGAWEHSELLPNGDLLVVGAERIARRDSSNSALYNDKGRYLLRFNWQGDLLWRRDYPAHHDVEVSPQGDLILLGFEYGIVPQMDPEVPVRQEQILRLNGDGSLITTYSIHEAVRRSRETFALSRVRPSRMTGRPIIDLYHANSVEWMRHPDLVGRHRIYDSTNILVCFRHQNRVAVFDTERLEVVWSWGRGEISGPHDAHTLADGNILLFDNGMGKGRSRAVEVDPLSNEIVWQYTADPPSDFNSLSRGSVQRLENGNTLLAESDEGRAFEVTPEGEIVWEFICPHYLTPEKRASIVRMTRFPIAFIERLNEGG